MTLLRKGVPPESTLIPQSLDAPKMGTLIGDTRSMPCTSKNERSRIRQERERPFYAITGICIRIFPYSDNKAAMVQSFRDSGRGISARLILPKNPTDGFGNGPLGRELLHILGSSLVVVTILNVFFLDFGRLLDPYIFLFTCIDDESPTYLRILECHL